MPGSLKNKLSQFEAVPPTDAWEKIAIRLDEEFVAADTPLALKLENAVVEPPPGMFDKIEAGLREPVPLRAEPLYRKMALAAAIIGVFILGAIYFLNSNNETMKSEIVNNSALSAPTARDTTNELIANNNSGKLSSPSMERRGTPVARQVKTLLRRSSGELHQKQSQVMSFADWDIDDPKPVQMVSAIEPVQVDAPPIRDAGGNIIMDLSVISNPNEPYIIVTSPNGSQTKISSKFLDYLSYLNSNYAASEINYEGQQWESRFAEWRNKLTEAGFVPGANNFFDIFELQELISD